MTPPCCDIWEDYSPQKDTEYLSAVTLFMDGGAGGGVGGGGGGGGKLNIRPPAENKMMGTYDPNYQTLAGLNN
ncbi:unnamed protein product, partial [Strongylus vulgaris]